MSGFASARSARLKWLQELVKLSVEKAAFTVTVGSVMDQYIMQFGVSDKRAFADLEIVCRVNGYVIKDGAVKMQDEA